MLNKKITILGNGSWSSALAKILTDNGHTIQWWMRSTEALEKIKSTSHNPHYLTSVKYNNATSTTSLTRVVAILICISVKAKVSLALCIPT